MVKVTETPAKVSCRKKTIAVKDVFIEEIDNEYVLVDDDGTNILAEIKDVLPEGVNTFSFKIAIELPDEDDFM